MVSPLLKREDIMASSLPVQRFFQKPLGLRGYLSHKNYLPFLSKPLRRSFYFEISVTEKTSPHFLLFCVSLFFKDGAFITLAEGL